MNIDIVIFFFLLLIAVVIFILGVYKKQVIFLGFSSLMFLFLGIWCMSGIYYTSSQNVTMISSTNSIVNDLDYKWSSSFTYPLSWLLIFWGLFLMFITIMSLIMGKYILLFSGFDENNNEED